MKTTHDVILFDLGGVLVELAGGASSRWREWIGPSLTDAEDWKRWFESESVRRFETGRAGPAEFAASIIKEMALPTTPKEFLREFTSWPKGVYEGGHELLEALGRRYRLACLSNTNELHWPRVRDEMDLARHFSVHFLSHKTGLIKPDRSPFEHAVKELNCSPDRILYLDDNQVCVDSARSVGLDAHRVQGLAEAVSVLEKLRILPVE